MRPWIAKSTRVSIATVPLKRCSSTPTPRLLPSSCARAKAVDCGDNSPNRIGPCCPTTARATIAGNSTTRRRCSPRFEEQGPLRLLPSGGLQPARSALAVFGITAEAVAPSLLDAFWYHRRESETTADLTGPVGRRYAFPEKTLSKWSRDRLTIEERPDGGLAARFRFDGTTCSSLGMPLSFDYSIHLGADNPDGRRIVDTTCRPAEGDCGHRSMCGYLADPERMKAAFDKQPWRGRRLDDAVGQSGEISPSGCLCLESNRNHKWSIVLHTLHYHLQTGME